MNFQSLEGLLTVGDEGGVSALEVLLLLLLSTSLGRPAWGDILLLLVLVDESDDSFPLLSSDLSLLPSRRLRPFFVDDDAFRVALLGAVVMSKRCPAGQTQLATC